MLGIINQTTTKMPANMFSEVNANQIPEDHRALQLAFELSVLRMNGDEEVPNLASSTMDSETARKRSANMTECVPVPSSEHVAEIVGRQGKLYISFIDINMRPRAFVYRSRSNWPGIAISVRTCSTYMIYRQQKYFSHCLLKFINNFGEFLVRKTLFLAADMTI